MTGSPNTLLLVYVENTELRLVPPTLQLLSHFLPYKACNMPISHVALRLSTENLHYNNSNNEVAKTRFIK